METRGELGLDSGGFPLSKMSSSKVSKSTRFAIFGAAGLAFCGVLVETSMNVTFPTLMRQFHTSLNAVQWVTTAYLLAVAATMVVTAFMQRRLTWRLLVNIGGGAFVLGGVLCAMSISLWLLLAGRIIQAVGTGFVMPLVFTQIMRQVPVDVQGRYTGTAGMLIALAPSLGPTYGGLVTQLASWRLIFWLTLPVGIVAWLITTTHIAQPAAPEKRRFPSLQFILIIVALIALTWSLNSIGTTGFSFLNFWLPLLVTVLSLSVWVLVTQNSDQSLIDVAIFKNQMFSRAVFIYFCIQFVQIGLTFLLPNFTQLALGKNALMSGLLLLAGSLTSAGLSPLAGRLMDNNGIKQLARIGSLILLVATGCFAVSQLSIPLIVLLFVVFQIGFSLLFNNIMTFGLQQLPAHQLGDGNAIFNTLQQYAGSLGTMIMAALLATGSTLKPHGSSFVQTTAGTHLALWLGVVVTVVVCAIGFSLKDIAKN